jgi:hypothetical protein
LDFGASLVVGGMFAALDPAAGARFMCLSCVAFCRGLRVVLALAASLGASFATASAASFGASFAASLAESLAGAVAGVVCASAELAANALAIRTAISCSSVESYFVSGYNGEPTLWGLGVQTRAASGGA